jgi:hypothetical protein
MAIHELNFKNSSGLQIVIQDGKGNKMTKFHAFAKNGGKEATWRWVISKHDALIDCIDSKATKRKIERILHAERPDE